MNTINKELKLDESDDYYYDDKCYEHIINWVL